MTSKQKKLLERLSEGRRLLPAQIADVGAAKKLIQMGYAALEDDPNVKQRGEPVQVLVITDGGTKALQG